MDPKTTTTRVTPKISKPTPNYPNAITTTEPSDPEVLDSEPKETRPSHYDNQTTNEDPSQKLNEDSTRSTPWWWRFTLQGQNNEMDGHRITTFPPWFKEVEVTEFPAWIKKTVTASETVTRGKENLIKRVRLTENNQQSRQKLIESDKTLHHHNKVEKKPTPKDLVHVHGDDGMSSNQQREIQIPRHFRLPQQNRQSKYHAARQPGKLKQKSNTYSSRDSIDILNFTASPRRPLYKPNVVKTKRPNNVNDVVHTLKPTTYPDYEITVSQTDKRPLRNNTKVTIIENFDTTESKIKDESETEPIPQLSPKKTFRINKQRVFLEKVRKQKSRQRQIRFQSSNENRDNKRWLDDDADSLHPHQSEYRGNKRIVNEYLENDTSEQHYNVIQHNNDEKLAADYHERHDQNNFDTLIEDTNSITTDIGDDDRTINYKHYDTEVKQRFSEIRRPLPKLNIIRHTTTRRQKGDLPDDLNDENIPTETTNNFDNFNLLPNSGVTEIANIFKPSTIHTSNLAKLLESKKTQVTVLEPTPSTWFSEKPQSPPPNSRIGHSLHEHISPSKKHIALKPPPMLPHSFSVALSANELKTATDNVNESAKNKSK